MDARKQRDIALVYALDLELELQSGQLEQLQRKASSGTQLRPTPDERYRFVVEPAVGRRSQGGTRRPIVIGAGPCGYFAEIGRAHV